MSGIDEKIKEVETELGVLDAVISTLKNHGYNTKKLENKRKEFANRLLNLYAKESGIL